MSPMPRDLFECDIDKIIRHLHGYASEIGHILLPFIFENKYQIGIIPTVGFNVVKRDSNHYAIRMVLQTSSDAMNPSMKLILKIM